MCSSRSGFTLIETAVAGLVGLILVLALGLLGKNLVRQRISADSNSAAIDLAEEVMEKLKANPNVAPTSCSSIPTTCSFGAASPTPPQLAVCAQALCGSSAGTSHPSS